MYISNIIIWMLSKIDTCGQETVSAPKQILGHNSNFSRTSKVGHDLMS